MRPATDGDRIGPIFELCAGRTDRPFCKKSRWPTIASALFHTSLIIAFLTLLPRYVQLTFPKPSPQMMAFVVAAEASPAPPPPPGAPPPAPAPVVEEPPEPPPPLTAVPVVTPDRITHETGLVASVPVSGLTVAGGVPWGTARGLVGGLPAKPSPPPPPRPTEPIRVGGPIQRPALLHRVTPIYPLAAVNLHLEGVVVLEAVVDAEGRVTSVTVLRSQALLDKAAIEAVQQWRYEPLIYHGEAVSFVATVTVGFRLER